LVLLTRKQPPVVEPLAPLMLVLLPAGLLLAEPSLVVELPELVQPLARLRESNCAVATKAAACRAVCPDWAAPLASQAGQLLRVKRDRPVWQVPMHPGDLRDRKIHQCFQAGEEDIEEALNKSSLSALLVKSG
jgi:hypothetical protein